RGLGHRLLDPNQVVAEERLHVVQALLQARVGRLGHRSAEVLERSLNRWSHHLPELSIVSNYCESSMGGGRRPVNARLSACRPAPGGLTSLRRQQYTKALDGGTPGKRFRTDPATRQAGR